MCLQLEDNHIAHLFEYSDEEIRFAKKEEVLNSMEWHQVFTKSHVHLEDLEAETVKIRRQC